MKRIIVLALSLVCALSSFAFADTILTAPGTATTEVILKTENPIFSATVPTTLAIGVAGDGTVYTAQNAYIVNNGHAPIKVIGLSVKAKNGWETVDFDSSNQANMRIGSKQLAFELNGDKTTGKNTITFTQENFPAMSGVGGYGNTQKLNYNAVVPLQRELLDTNEGMMDIFFTLAWDE